MLNLKLPPELQELIRDFLHSSQSTLSNQETMNKFCEMLPGSLRQIFLNHVFISVTQDNAVLQYHLDVITEFINDMIPTLTQPDDVIINEGEKGK